MVLGGSTIPHGQIERLGRRLVVGTAPAPRYLDYVVASYRLQRGKPLHVHLCGE
jgi:hypothetical protein